jgi:thioredoxin reductase (NADPH)
MTDSAVTALSGGDRLSGITVRNLLNGEETEFAADGLFVAVGQLPETEVLQTSGVKLNAGGYIRTNARMKTNLKNVYAAGDITDGTLKQIITACAQGAQAAESARESL